MENALEITGQLAIPLAELEFTASRSSGPGGQHVQKTSSRITLRWSVLHSTALTEYQRLHLLQKLESRLTTEGDLLISAETSRSQLTNKRLACERLVEIVKAALHVDKPRKKTRPSKGSVARRIAGKKHVGEKKELRKKPGVE